MPSWTDFPLRVAAYCRVSTEKEDQLNSLSAQQRFFLEFIAEHPGWTLVRVYADGPIKIGLNQKHPTARGALV